MILIIEWLLFKQANGARCVHLAGGRYPDPQNLESREENE